MKRVYQPYGSPRARFSAAKRTRQTPPPARNRIIARRTPNAYSAFQKSSGIERKNIDDSSSKFTTGAATWTINCINDVAQGTSAITRLGRKILMKSILVQGALNSSTGYARILVVYDKQSNGASITATDVLTSNTMMAVQNLDNRDRFIILADIYPFAQDENLAESGLAGGPLIFKRYIKCNLETIYGGNAGTFADINSGALWYMTNLNGGTLTNETGIQRVRFVDE